MAIDIGVGDGSSFIPVTGEPTFCMDNDPAYCFLQPLFERLALETGQSVNLHGDAAFAGEHLVALKKMLVEARRLAELQPDVEEIYAGTPLAPDQDDVYVSLERTALLDLIIAWENIVARAEELGRPVVCFWE
jgi:hypothetical protein